MANNPFDQFDAPASAAAGSGNPFDQFDGGASKPAEAPSFTGSFSRGLKRTIPETKSLLAGAGAAVAGAVGADDVRDSLLSTYQDIQTNQVEPLANKSGFIDAVTGNGSLRDWAGDTLGNFAGQALQSVAAGAVGATLGSVVPGAGTVAGGIGGLVAKAGAKDMVEGAVARMVAKGVADGVARKQVLAQLGGAAAATTGLNVGQEVGIGFTGRAEDAKAAGQDLTQQDALRAIGWGVPAGLVDTAAEALTGKLVGEGISSAPRMLTRVAKGAGVGAVTEGGTEGVQAVMERAGAGQEMTGEQAYKDYIENVAAGALGGAVPGAAGGLRRQQPNTPPGAPPVQAPAAKAPDSGIPDPSIATQPGPLVRAAQTLATPPGAAEPAPAPVSTPAAPVEPTAVDGAPVAPATASTPAPAASPGEPLPVFDRALQLLAAAGKVSAGELGKQLKLSKDQTVALMDELQARGIVSGKDSRGQRRLLTNPATGEIIDPKAAEAATKRADAKAAEQKLVEFVRTNDPSVMGSPPAAPAAAPQADPAAFQAKMEERRTAALTRAQRPDPAASALSAAAASAFDTGAADLVQQQRVQSEQKQAEQQAIAESDRAAKEAARAQKEQITRQQQMVKQQQLDAATPDEADIRAVLASEMEQRGRVNVLKIARQMGVKPRVVEALRVEMAQARKRGEPMIPEAPVIDAEFTDVTEQPQQRALPAPDQRPAQMRAVQQADAQTSRLKAEMASSSQGLAASSVPGTAARLSDRQTQATSVPTPSARSDGQVAAPESQAPSGDSAYDTSADVLDSDITPPSGGAFSLRGAAEQAAKSTPGGKVFEVDGGFVVRTPRSVVAQAATTSPDPGLEDALRQERDAYTNERDDAYLNKTKHARDPVKDAIEDALNASVLDPDAARVVLDVALSNGRVDLAEYAVSRAERAVAGMSVTPGVPQNSPKYADIKAALESRKREATALLDSLKKDLAAAKTATVKESLTVGTVAQGDRVKIATRFGTSVYVNRADLEGDAKRMRYFTSTGKPAGVIVRDNLDPTGEKLAESNREDESNPLFDVITTKQGNVFATEAAAARERNRRGLQETYDITPAGGGFVLKRKAAAPTEPAPVAAAQTATEPTNQEQSNGEGKGQGQDGRQRQGRREALLNQQAEAAGPQGPAAADNAKPEKPSSTMQRQRMPRSDAVAEVQRQLGVTKKRATEIVGEIRSEAKNLDGVTYNLKPGIVQTADVQAAIERERAAKTDLGKQKVSLPEPAATAPATHKDPGQPAEPVTAPVITEAIKTSASKTPLNLKEARAWLLERVDEALKGAPKSGANVTVSDPRTEEGRKVRYVSTDVVDPVSGASRPRLRVVEIKVADSGSTYNIMHGNKVLDRQDGSLRFAILTAENLLLASKWQPTGGPAGSWDFTGSAPADFVTFDVPGDGKFKVLNTRENLEAFRAKVVASSGFKDERKRTAAAPMAKSEAWTVINSFLEDAEFGNAYTYSNAVDKPLRYALDSRPAGATEDGVVAYAVADDVEIAGFKMWVGRMVTAVQKTRGTWSVVEPKTGRVLASGNTRDAAIGTARALAKKHGDKWVAEKIKSEASNRTEAQREQDWLKANAPDVYALVNGEEEQEAVPVAKAANPQQQAVQPAPAQPQDETAKPAKANDVDARYEHLLSLKSTRLMDKHSDGRALYEVTLSMEQRKALQDSRGQFNRSVSFELKTKEEVTGNKYATGYVLIDRREQNANRAALEAKARPVDKKAITAEDVASAVSAANYNHKGISFSVAAKHAEQVSAKLKKAGVPGWAVDMAIQAGKDQAARLRPGDAAKVAAAPIIESLRKNGFIKAEAAQTTSPTLAEAKKNEPLTEWALQGFIKIAADSVQTLRPVDVERVIRETPAQHRQAVAEYIKKNSYGALDLEVDDVARELGVTMTPVAPDLKGFKLEQTDSAAFDLVDGNMRVSVVPMADGKFQASYRGAKSSPHLQSKQAAIDWAAGYRDEAKRLAAPASSVQGQKNMAARGGRIATLMAMNGRLRKLDPDSAWLDSNIEQADDLDALQDQISEALTKAERGKQPTNALRSELEQMSGAELRVVFDRMSLAGARMTHIERVEALMAEDEAAVRAAMAAVQPEATTGPADAKGERKFYVTMIRDSKVARIAGPFDTKEEADAMLPAARDKAKEVDPRAVFDAFGVSAVTMEEHKPAALNEQLGIGKAAPSSKPAAADNLPTKFISIYNGASDYSVYIRRIGKDVRVGLDKDGNFKNIQAEITDDEKASAIASVNRFIREDAVEQVKYLESRGLDVPAELRAKADAKPAAKEYRYAMVNRPVGIGAAPKGVLRVDPRPANGEPHHDQARHGIAVYDRKLTDEETKQFEMAPLADGADLEALAKRIADMVRNYADGYIEMAANENAQFVGAVWEKLKRASDGYRPSIGDPKQFAGLVLEQLKAGSTEAKPAAAPTIPEGYKPTGEPYYVGKDLVQGYAKFPQGERVKLASGIQGVVTGHIGKGPILTRAMVKFDNGTESGVDERELSAVAAAKQDDDAPTMTRPEARELMFWQDMGQKDGEKSHRLTFYTSKDDAENKRGSMTYGKITKDQGSSKWFVEDGDSFTSLADAKRQATEMALDRAEREGFIAKDAPAKQEAQAKATATPPQAADFPDAASYHAAVAAYRAANPATPAAPKQDRRAEIKRELAALQQSYEKRMNRADGAVPPAIKADALAGIARKMDKLTAELKALDAAKAAPGKPEAITDFGEKLPPARRAMFAKGAAPGWDRNTVLEGWRELATKPDSFIYPTSEAIALEDIAAEVYPDLAIAQEVDELYTLTLPEQWVVKNAAGKVARVFKSKAKADVYAADTGGKVVYQEPTQGALVQHPDNEDHWFLSVADWKPGQDGARVYSVVLNWAHNNGKVLVPDPDHLTPINEYRRTEQMVASALRYGTTAHMRPDESQRVPWINEPTSKANNDANVDALLRRSYENGIEVLPELLEVDYDPTDTTPLEGDKDWTYGRFRDRITGVDRTAEIVRLVGTAGPRERGIGRTTLARIAHTLALLRGDRRAGRDAVLATDVPARPASAWSLIRRFIYGKDDAQQQSRRLTKLQLEKLLGPAARALKAARPGLEVIFVANHAELQAHPDARDIVQQSDYDTTVQAAINGDRTKVFFIAESIRSPRQALKLFAHEMVGHYSMEQMLGARLFTELRDRILALRDAGKWPEVFAEVTRRYERNADGTFRALDDDTFAAEAIAVFAEKNIQTSILQRALNAMRGWLRKFFPQLNLSQGELRQMLWEAGQYLEGKPYRPDVAARALGQRTPKTAQEAMARYAFGKDGTETIDVDGVARPVTDSTGKPIHPTEEGLRNFWRWFGDSKVVDSQGRPLVAYHGTSKSFDAFSDPESAPDDWNRGLFFTDNARIASTIYAARPDSIDFDAVESAVRKLPRAKVIELSKKFRIGFIWDSPDWTTDDIKDQFIGDVEQSFDWTEGEQQPAVRLANELLGYGYALTEGANILPVYLRIKNPKTIDARDLELDLAEQAKWLSDAKKDGHDGMILRNRDDGGTGMFDTYTSAGRHTVFVAFRPAQAKSAIGNDGAFSPTDTRVSFAKAGTMVDRLQELINPKDTTLLQRIKNKLSDWRPAALGALQLRHLGELAEDILPPVATYSQVVQRMATMRNELQELGHDVVDAGMKYQGANPEEAKKLFRMLHDATLAGVDPAEAHKPLQMMDAHYRENVDVTPENVRAFLQTMRGQAKLNPGSAVVYINRAKEARKLLNQERRRAQSHREMSPKFARLSADAKKLWVQMRDAYRTQSAEYEKALISRIESLDFDKAQKAGQIARMRLMFESARVPFYIPLARWGEYWVSGTNADGQREFYMQESAQAQQRVRKELADSGYKEIAHGVKLDTVRAQDGASASFMAEMDEMLKKSGAPDKIRDEAFQLYLRSLPDLSIRQNFIHRQGTPGYSQDALRALAGHIFHGSFQIARLRYSHELEAIRTEAEGMAKDMSKADDPAANAAGNIVNELKKRHEWVMNPQDNPVVNKISSVGFVYYLGLTPAAALVNLLQTPMVALPVLAGKHKVGDVTRELWRAMKQSLGTYGHMQKQLEGEELEAHTEFGKRGVFDKTQSANLAGISESDTHAYSPRWHKTMSVISHLFHKGEIFNREATAMAAYRLERAAGAGHLEAIEAADRAVHESHFDYSNANRARYMQSGAAKVLLMFRQYSLAVTWLLGRNLWQSMKGMDAQTRTEARRKLAGVLGMTAIFSGTLGLPLLGTVGGVMNALAAAFGDDDEPWDWETEFRAFMRDMLGDTGAEAVLNGPVQALTGVGIASRVSMGDLWFREPDRELEGRAWSNYLFEQAAGPMGGLITNFFRGQQLMSEGQVWRGVETIMPKAIKDAMKSVRYLDEGVNNLRGDAIVADLNVFESLAQIAGFSPASVSDAYDTARDIKNYEQAILSRRSRLMDAFALAWRLGDTDAREEILVKMRKFSQTYPELAITGDSIKRSLTARARASAQADGGVIVDKRIRARLEAQLG